MHDGGGAERGDGFWLARWNLKECVRKRFTIMHLLLVNAERAGRLGIHLHSEKKAKL